MAKNTATDKPSKSDLFAAYREYEAELATADEARLEIQKNASLVISEIVTHYGPGPYKLSADKIVRARKAKETLGGLYSFHTQDLAAEEV